MSNIKLLPYNQIPFKKAKYVDDNESFYRLIYVIFRNKFIDHIFTEGDCLIEYTKSQLQLLD